MPIADLLFWCLTGTASLALMALGIAARRAWLRKAVRRHELHVRIIRSELMQAVARGDNRFLIEHWKRADRIAALEVAGQVLSFLGGQDRERLEQIAEVNEVLHRPLQRINRLRTAHRIASIRQLAPFGNKSVQSTLHIMMREDWSPKVRLEAALAISVAGTLPPPNTILRCVWKEGEVITAKHRALFRRMASEKVEALIAIALYREQVPIRLLAIETLGYADREKAGQVREALARLLVDATDDIRNAALEALNTLAKDRRASRSATKSTGTPPGDDAPRRLAS